jgi:hypothetical protein
VGVLVPPRRKPARHLQPPLRECAEIQRHGLRFLLIDPLPREEPIALHLAMGIGAQDAAYRLGSQAQPLQIGLSPPRLMLEHATQRFGRKGLARAMERHRHPAAIWMTIMLVSPRLSVEHKPIAPQSGDDLARGERP